ncbi:ABC transporter ATP-binding protein [Bordetella pertussis]|nr:ABC transporter ATP-binding protein [Bordetella pertussis]
MSASVSITLENCAKTWPGGSRALQALDLHIPGGEILALLGPRAVARPRCCG